jgi:hypothetical protein
MISNRERRVHSVLSQVALWGLGGVLLVVIIMVVGG